MVWELWMLITTPNESHTTIRNCQNAATVCVYLYCLDETSLRPPQWSITWVEVLIKSQVLVMDLQSSPTHLVVVDYPRDYYYSRDYLVIPNGVR